MSDEVKEWYDSKDLYDIPKWYEEEEAILMDKFLNEEENDCIEVFIKNTLLKDSYSGLRILVFKRGIIVN